MRTGWRIHALKITKLTKIVIIEGGMLGGIVLAAYTVPGRTPLKTFAIASAAIFLIGNVLLFRSLDGDPKAETSGDGFWPRILRLHAMLALVSLLILALHRC